MSAFGQAEADADGRVDFSRPVRRLGATEALTLLRPALAAEPPKVASASRRPGWLAALFASLSTAFQRS